MALSWWPSLGVMLSGGKRPCSRLWLLPKAVQFSATGKRPSTLAILGTAPKGHLVFSTSCKGDGICHGNSIAAQHSPLPNSPLLPSQDSDPESVS